MENRVGVGNGGEALGRDVRERSHRETTWQRHSGRKGDPEHRASLSGSVSPTQGNEMT